MDKKYFNLKKISEVKLTALFRKKLSMSIFLVKLI